MRLKLGKPGRTLTVDGRFNYQNNEREQRTAANEASGIPYKNPDYQTEYDNYFGEGKSWHDMGALDANGNPLYPSLYSPLYQYIHRPNEEYTIRANVTYNEPISQYAQFSLQYRMGYENEVNDKNTFYTDSKWDNQVENPSMTQKYQSGFWTHRVGPGFRYSKSRNTVVVNLSYQRSELDGNIIGEQGDKINKNYDDFSYFAMANLAFNRENTLRVFLRSWTDNPSVTQLQSIYDVSNPQYISVGNTNLNPAFAHNLSAHYNLSKVDKGITFMWMFNAQLQQDYISTSVFNNSEGWDLPDGFGIPKDKNGDPYRPNQIASYENLDGYTSLRTHVSLGVPLSFMKCNLNIMAGVNYTVMPSAVYGSVENMIAHKYTVNHANNIGYDASVTLGSNISENIDFTLSWNGTFNQAWNTSAKNGGKNNYFNHSATGTLKWVFWKGFTFTASCSFVQYKGFTTDYDESYVLCNLYLGKKLFRNQRGEVQIGVNDVANQNTAFVRSTGSGYTQNLTNSVIGRYFSVQFVYNLRHFGKRGSKQMKDYDYKESSGTVGMGNSNGGARFGSPMRR